MTRVDGPDLVITVPAVEVLDSCTETTDQLVVASLTETLGGFCSVRTIAEVDDVVTIVDCSKKLVPNIVWNLYMAFFVVAVDESWA